MPQNRDRWNQASGSLGRPKSVGPIFQAKYIDLLRNSKHLTLKQIVDYCGGREREVADYIEAYEVMESSYRKQLTVMMNLIHKI